MKRKPRRKTTPPRSELAAKLRLVFDLYAAGENMMRQGLMRRHPNLSPDAVETKLRAWLQARPKDSPDGFRARPALR